MLIKDFRVSHSEDICTLPFSNIYLTENIHVRGLTCGDTFNTRINDPVLIVRKIEGENDKYALVSGYNAFCLALMNHSTEVKVIIVPDKSRKAFFKSLRNSPEMVEVSSLKVPKGWTPPRDEKVAKCISHYHTVGTLGKNVIIDERNEIIDGYAAVVAAQKIGVEKIFAIQMARKEWIKTHSKKNFSKTS